MPLYEYLCAGCGERAELLLPLGRSDDPGACPACGGALQRRFSRIAVKLEGWGFKGTDALVPDRPGGRNDWRAVRERAEKLSDTGDL